VRVSDTYRGLGWKYGALTVQRHAAMLAPLTFVLADGRQVSPMHIAPWAEEPVAATLPGILQRLRGEWPCVPFGYAVDDPTAPPDWARLNGPAEPGEEIHGHSSNHPWDWAESDGASLKLSLDYPATSPVKRVHRTVTPDSRGPAVDITFTIEIREDCRLPLGLHPSFRLPREAQQARIEPGPFREGRTYPGTVEPSAPLFAIDQSFTSLDAVPKRDGGTFDASRVPLPLETEELLQLNGISSVALANEAEGYRVRLSWNEEHFPSLLLWMSNRGRKAEPWNGRHLALGMEPICSPFGLGPASARADNPMAKSGTPTARNFKAGDVFTTHYRIEAEAL
jgi:hypothetical protein